jgi:hypothetical protein
MLAPTTPPSWEPYGELPATLYAKSDGTLSTAPPADPPTECLATFPPDPSTPSAPLPPYP